ncbi:NAD(P)H-dependent oxidoreductase [Treponema putidum]|uniref:NAD(P)H-dependent oxidoreductase n=1 Tax=Treponema putidum TaxID=221027 RepID=UPI003D903A5C
MKKLLIVTGHTHAKDSVGNKKIVALLQEKYPDAEFDDLNVLYPDYAIDIAAEKEKLLRADMIIIQSPLFWYSMTSLIMRWLEEVFEHGWAYGSKGHALDGKKIIIGITAGSTNDDYATGGKMGISVDEILKPYKKTFDFCRMNYAGAVFIGGMLNTGNSTSEEKAAMEKLAERHYEKNCTAHRVLSKGE